MPNSSISKDDELLNLGDAWFRILSLHPLANRSPQDVWLKRLAAATQHILDRPDALVGECVSRYFLAALADPFSSVSSLAEVEELSRERTPESDGRFLIDLSRSGIIDAPELLSLLREKLSSAPCDIEIVIDLRLRSRPRNMIMLRRALGFFTAEPLLLPQRCVNMFLGWAEDSHPSYSRGMFRADPERLNPISGCQVKRPVTIIVNTCSLAGLEPELFALENAGRARVVFERTSSPNSYGSGFTLCDGSTLILRTVSYGPEVEERFAIWDERCAISEEGDSKSSQGREEDEPEISDKAVAIADILKVRGVLENFFPHSSGLAINPTNVAKRAISELLDGRIDGPDALIRLSVSLADSHSWVQGCSPLAEDYIPPLYLAKVDEHFKIGWIAGQAEKPADFPEGEEVLEIDGIPVVDVYRGFEGRISASTPQAYESRVLANGLLLAGPKGSACRLTLVSKDILVERSLLRFDALPWHRRGEFRVSGDTFYINLCGLQSMARLEELIAEAIAFSGVVLDLRGDLSIYPHPLVVPWLGGPGPFAPRYACPSFLALGDGARTMLEVEQATWKASVETFRGRLAVLIGKDTLSAAEDLALHLKGRLRTALIGGVTSGCNGDTARILLAEGRVFHMTGVDVLDGHGGAFQRIGITPDLLVSEGPPPVDAQLEAAFSWLREV